MNTLAKKPALERDATPMENKKIRRAWLDYLAPKTQMLPLPNHPITPTFDSQIDL
jgi:hypothetical protein